MTKNRVHNIDDTAIDIAYAIVEHFDESDPSEQFVPYGKYMLTFKGNGEPERFDINVYSDKTKRSFTIGGWLIPDSGGLNLIDFVEDIGYIVAMLVEAEK